MTFLNRPLSPSEMEKGGFERAEFGASPSLARLEWGTEGVRPVLENAYPPLILKLHQTCPYKKQVRVIYPSRFDSMISEYPPPVWFSQVRISIW
jgi:hypothetical protein